MSIRVTKETSESEFQTQKDKIDECKSALNSAKGTFTTALGTAKSNVSTALSGMSAWAADDVQVKLDDFCVNELQEGIDAIENDITGGSYNSLINTAGTLSGDFAACKELKKAWEDAKKTLENTPKTRKVANNANWSLSYQGGQNPNNADYGFHYETNPDYENNAKAVEKAEKALEQRVTSTNTHLSELSQFVYGGASSANNAVGGASTLGSQTGSSSAMETSQRAAQEAADRENAIAAYMAAYEGVSRSEAESAVDAERGLTSYDMILRKYSEVAATAALATYVGDDAPSAVVSEESDSSIRFEQDADGDGVTGYEEKTHEKKDFEDGVKTDMNYNTTGDADITDPENPVKDPKHKTGEGTLTDKAGEVHDVKTDEIWGENGKHVEDVTVSKDGELEVHKNDDTHIEGTSSPDKEVKSETKTTDIREQDGSTTSVKSTEIKSTIGDNSATQTQTSKTNDSDPEVGVTERTDGNHTYKYETYRDNSGNLHERVYEDGVLQSDDQVEHDYRTVTVKDSSGKTMLTRTYDLGTERGLEEFYSDASNAATEATDQYGFGYDPEVVRGDAPVILGDFDDGTMDFYETQVTVEKADRP